MYNYDPNGNTGDVVANGADTYITGTTLPFTGRVIPGTTIVWRFVINKTAAGTATPTFTVRLGSTKSVSDTAVLSFTLAAQTAAIDTAVVELTAIVRGVSSTGVFQGNLVMHHKGTTTGFSSSAQVQIVPALSSTVNTIAPDQFIGVSCNPGASGVWTFVIASVQCQ